MLWTGKSVALDNEWKACHLFPDELHDLVQSSELQFHGLRFSARVRHRGSVVELGYCPFEEPAQVDEHRGCWRRGFS